MLSDAGALALTLVAMRFARRPATSQRTYGSYRAEILAALVNGATLVAVATSTSSWRRSSDSERRPRCRAALCWQSPLAAFRERRRTLDPFAAGITTT